MLCAWMHAKLLQSCRCFVTPWIVVCQAPLSMGFFRQEYWSRLLCPPPKDLPNPRIKTASLMSPALASRCWATEPLGKPEMWCFYFSSVAQPCLTLCDRMDCSTPGLPVHHQLLELTQTHVHRVSDVIQPSHSLSSPSPPTFNLSQHQGLYKCVSSLHQVAKVLEFQLQSFQWIFKTDFL